MPDLPFHGSHGMTNPNDVTIDIPLQSHPSHVSHASQGQSGEKWGSSSAVSPEQNEQNEDESGIKGLIGRRRTTGFESNEKDSDSPLDGTINRIGRFYQAFYNFSIVTRYAIYVIPIGFLIAIPIIVGATAAPNAEIGGVHIYWFFTWIEVLWVSLWGCKVFAQFFPYVFQSLCGVVSSGTRKYALILRALETPLTLVLWNVIALVTFLPIMRYGAGNSSGVSSWESSIKNILFGLLICSLIYMVEKAVVQLISISYHRKQFDAKIKESKRNVHLVSVLFDASRKIFPMYCPEFREEDTMIFDSLLSQATGKATKGRSNIMPLRMVQNVGRQVGHNVGRIGDKVTSAFGNVAAELTGKQVFNPNATHSIVIQALERKRCAAAMARRIWLSFVVEGRDALYMEDIAEVLGPDYQTEAEECFNAIDKDGNGDISLDEMILTITEFGRTRKALNHSMHDVDQAIRVLDGLLMCIAGVLGVLVFLSFVTSGLHTIITTGASALLSVSFAFSSTAAEVLGSCVFLFVKHPFDIGDRVEVSDKPYIVERISLLYSVFRNVNDHRMTQVPNNILNSLWVDNFTRSNSMHEQLKVAVAFDTTFAEVEALREEMELFVRDKENSRDFHPDINIEIVGVGDDVDKLQIRVDIRHKSNWANEIVRATRRSKFMCALVLALRKLNIRSPGKERAEESKDDDDKSDKGADETEPGAGVVPTTTAAAVVAADALKSQETLTSNTAAASGFDRGQQSSGTLHKRDKPQDSEAAMADKLNSRSSALGIPTEDGLHRTKSNSTTMSGQSHLGVGASGSKISSGLSTGHRKAGTSINDVDDNAANNVLRRLSSVRSGISPISDAPMMGAAASGATYQTTSPYSLPTITTQESGTYNVSQYQSQSQENYQTQETSYEQTGGRSLSTEFNQAFMSHPTETHFSSTRSFSHTSTKEKSSDEEYNS
ncbi:hypothetical protein N7528_000497 [Penicillium herquei]|nr:hypothetical protein N7528_000497 [Penicillium herquei]